MKTTAALILTAFSIAAFAGLDDLPLVYEEDFESGLDGWTMTDPNAWALVDSDDGKALALQKDSDYEPEVRSPKSIARIADLNVTDFVLEAQLKQTGREYGHRDLCIFFGYQDPSNFYYCHMATKADDHANSIFLSKTNPAFPSPANVRTVPTGANPNSTPSALNAIPKPAP
jgi:hypothetical protein